MPKTMSIRMDEENYEFLNRLARDEDADVSKTVREVVRRGRLMLALERHRKGTASLERAAEIAGVPVVEMIATLREFGLRTNLRKEECLEGLRELTKIW